MSNDKEQDERALFEAALLERIRQIMNMYDCQCRDMADEIVEAAWQARAALAQPACDVEPVAWQYRSEWDVLWRDCPKETYDLITRNIQSGQNITNQVRKLYTHPPQDVQAAVVDALRKAQQICSEEADKYYADPVNKGRASAVDCHDRILSLITEAEQVKP